VHESISAPPEFFGQYSTQKPSGGEAEKATDFTEFAAGDPCAFLKSCWGISGEAVMQELPEGEPPVCQDLVWPGTSPQKKARLETSLPTVRIELPE